MPELPDLDPVIHGKLRLAVLSLLAVGVYRGINTRIKAAASVKQDTIDMSVPTVSVVHPKRGALKDEIVLPGNIQAFTISPIYARTSGYLKKWYFDIGGRVKTGQLLAEIEGSVQTTAKAAAPIGLAAGVGTVLLLLIVAYLLGRRRGNKRRTVVEIRRI